MRSATVLWMLGAGCFAKPGAPMGTDDRDASIGDGDSSPLPDDALASVLCTIDDDFSVPGPPCGTWGTATGTMMRTSEQLIATAPTNGISTCTTQPLQPSGTITIELLELGNLADQNYALFSLGTRSGDVTLNIYRTSGTNTVNAGCDVPPAGPVYSPSVHRFFRYTLTPLGNDLIVSLAASADDTSFTSELVSCPFMAGALGPVTLTFGSAVDGTAAQAPISRWDDLRYACQ